MIAVVKGVFYNFGLFFRILKGVGHFMHRGQAAYKILIMQVLFTFVEALSIASLLALTIGAAINIVGMPFLASLGQDRLIYTLLIIIITRELGPLLTAFIIIARSATAIATEIAGMVISHEVEAYISVGVDPIEHLAVPRFLGVTISLFMLNIFFSISGLVGSYFISLFFNPLPAQLYFGNLLEVLTLGDIGISVLKSISFGMLISFVAVSRGFQVERASTEIPVAGLRAVGAAFGGCILINVILSALFYMV